MYGNVAVQYQKEKETKPKIQQDIRPSKQPRPTPETGISTAEKVLYLFVILFVVTTLSLLLMRSATISQLNYEVQALEAEKLKIEERNTNLQLQVAELSAPERIIEIAKEEWGLRMNESSVIMMPSETGRPVQQSANQSEPQYPKFDDE